MSNYLLALSNLRSALKSCKFSELQIHEKDIPLSQESLAQNILDSQQHTTVLHHKDGSREIVVCPKEYTASSAGFVFRQSIATIVQTLFGNAVIGYNATFQVKKRKGYSLEIDVQLISRELLNFHATGRVSTSSDKVLSFKSPDIKTIPDLVPLIVDDAPIEEVESDADASLDESFALESDEPVVKEPTKEATTAILEVLNEVGGSVSNSLKTAEQVEADAFPNTVDPQPVEPITPPEVAIEKAQESLSTLDVATGLEELELGAGRVEVDDKRMINCRADLNQLVPFKYAWAWQDYLKATEHHWMHAEVGIEKGFWVHKDGTFQMSFVESKVIASALFTMEKWGVFNAHDPLLNIYRFVTNPEARQYILRQRFEHTVWANLVHAIWDHIVDRTANADYSTAPEGYMPVNDAEYLGFFKQKQVNARQGLRKNIDVFVGDPNFVSTTDVDSRVDLVSRLIAYYIGQVFTFNFTSTIQVMALGYKDKEQFVGLANGMRLILRDIALQTSFGINVIRQIFAENPDIVTPESTKLWLELFDKIETAESDYLDWYSAYDLPECKNSHQMNTLRFMLSRFKTQLFREEESDSDGPIVQWYVEAFDKNYPDNGSATQSSVLGSTSNGTLAWD